MEFLGQYVKIGLVLAGCFLVLSILFEAPDRALMATLVVLVIWILIAFVKVMASRAS